MATQVQQASATPSAARGELRRFFDEWFFEVVVAIFCFVIGAFGIRIANDSALWNQLVQGSRAAQKIGVLERQTGGVRYRNGGSVMWHDVPARADVASGDTVFTGEDGKAELRLGEGVQAEILPNSLVLVQKAEPESDSTLKKWLSSGVAADLTGGLVGQAAPAVPTVQIQKGSSRIKLDPHATVKIVSQDKAIDVRSSDTAEDLDVVIDEESGKPEFKIIAATHSRIKVSEPAAIQVVPFRTSLPKAGQRLTMKIVQAAGMSARPSVQFSWDWLSKNTVPSAQIEIQAKPGTAPLVQPVTAGETSKRLILEPGDYRWRLTAAAAGANAKGFETPWVPFSVSVLHPPKPLGPFPDATVIQSAGRPDQPVSLSWEKVSPGFTPEIEILEDKPGAQPRLVKGGLSGTSLSLPAGSYLWRLRTVDESGATVSDWSESRKFGIRPASKDPVEDEKLIKGSGIFAPVALNPAAIAQSVPSPTPISPPSPVAAPVVAPAAPAIAIQTPAVAKAPAAPLTKAKPVQAPPKKVVAPPAPPVKKIRVLPTIAVAAVSANTSVASDDDSLDQMQIALNWGAVTDAKAYHVTVFKSGNIKHLEKTVTEPKLLLTLTSLESTDFSYKVVAELNTGEKIPSGALPIKVELSPPAPKSPDDGSAIENGDTALLTWESTLLSQSYKLQISTDSQFKTIVSTQDTAENFFLFSPTKPGVYFWRVQSLAAPYESRWSRVYKLKVD